MNYFKKRGKILKEVSGGFVCYPMAGGECINCLMGIKAIAIIKDCINFKRRG
jgi:hypothetical protein